MGHHLQRQRDLCPKHALRLGYPGPLAALRIFTPALLQIQARINQGHTLIATQCGHDSDLAILHLPTAPKPLSANAHRVLARLLEASFIKQ
jgi:hypothetical protein